MLMMTATLRGMEMVIQGLSGQQQRSSDTLQNVMDANARIQTQAIENALRSTHRNHLIKFVGIDAFWPYRQRGQGKENERYETDVQSFLRKITPALQGDHLSEEVKMKSLISHTRGAARDLLMQYPQDGSYTCNHLLQRLNYEFQSREASHVLRGRLLRDKRRPGEHINKYRIYLEGQADTIIRKDPNLREVLMHDLWLKILQECPDNLSAELCNRFAPNQLTDAMAYISLWTGQHNEESPFSNKNLRKEEREKERKYNPKWNQSKGSKPNIHNLTVDNKTPLPAIEQAAEEGEEEGEEDAMCNACFKCKREGHIRRDCLEGATKQTLVKRDGKPNWKSKSNSNNGNNRSGQRNWRDRSDRRESNFNKRKCKLCYRAGHDLQYCNIFKRAKAIMKEQQPEAVLNYAQLASSDPNHEELNPLRVTLMENLHWEQDSDEEESVEDLISVLITSPELYKVEEEDESESDE